MLRGAQLLSSSSSSELALETGFCVAAGEGEGGGGGGRMPASCGGTKDPWVAGRGKIFNPDQYGGATDRCDSVPAMGEALVDGGVLFCMEAVGQNWTGREGMRTAANVPHCCCGSAATPCCCGCGCDFLSPTRGCFPPLRRFGSNGLRMSSWELHEDPNASVAMIRAEEKRFARCIEAPTITWFSATIKPELNG